MEAGGVTSFVAEFLVGTMGEEQFHVISALLSGLHQRSQAVAILRANVCATAHQQRDDISTALEGGPHKGSAAERVGSVGIRPVVEECPRDFRLAVGGGEHEHGGTTRILAAGESPQKPSDAGAPRIPLVSGVCVCALLQPRTHDSGIATNHRRDQATVKRLLPMLPVEQGTQHGDENGQCQRAANDGPCFTLKRDGGQTSDVVGSMVAFTCEIRLAGKPPCSACWRTISSLGAT
jgi:hypothetical protein